jgi:hypothetical protein
VCMLHYAADTAVPDTEGHYDTRMHIVTYQLFFVDVGPGTWEVEGSSWTGLAGSLPNLKRLSVAAVMTGRISALPGRYDGCLAVTGMQLMPSQ